jgi:WXXGXW repeat (2 copies)
MRFLSPTVAALLIGASAPIGLVAPAFAQTCVCPPAGEAISGPVIEAGEAPPPLPVYEQPPMPAPGYHWTPGYWAWNNTDYYWVPGVWVEPPRVGVLWTPPYWGFVGGVFLFHAGYWAPHLGFYGGINYGFGYAGAGYAGGRWENGQFFYNRAVNNLGAAPVTRVYNQPITINNTTINRVSYNGGQGGLQVKPTPEQEQVAAEQHIAATPAQVTQVRTASVNPEQFHSTNQGRPPVAATTRPGELKGPGAVPAKAIGAAETIPAGHNVPAKGEETLRPGEKPATRQPMVGEKPNPEEKTLPGAKPAGIEKPIKSEKPIKTEELNTQKAQERLPAADKAMERPVEKSMEKPAAKRPEKSREPEKPEKPQGLMKPPAERQITPAMSGGPERPGMAQNNDPRRAAERKPPRPEGKPRECGRPGLPPCPK